MLPAGRLRHRVSVQALSVTLDADTGIRTEAWAEIALVPAEVAPLSGRELIAAQSVQSKTTTRVRMRYRPDITSTHRLVHGSTVYNIESVVPDPVSGIRHLTLLCSTGVNDG